MARTSRTTSGRINRIVRNADSNIVRVIRDPSPSCATAPSATSLRRLRMTNSPPGYGGDCQRSEPTVARGTDDGAVDAGVDRAAERGAFQRSARDDVAHREIGRMEFRVIGEPIAIGSDGGIHLRIEHDQIDRVLVDVLDAADFDR